MSRSFRVRIGALITASTIAVAGLLAGAPANAAGAAITVAHAVYHTGSWDSGVTVSGTGFAPNSTVTLDVKYAMSESLGGTTTTTDASGSFTDVTFTPTTAPFAAGPNDKYYVTAADGAGNTASPVLLDVRWPAGITPNVLELWTTDFVKPSSGFELSMTGFEPGETVSGAADYNGIAVAGIQDLTAGPGGILYSPFYYLAEGTATAGPITFTFTGVTSGVTLTAQVRVRGTATPSAGGGTVLRFGLGNGATVDPVPTPAAPQADGDTGGQRLPVVAG